MEKLSNIDNNVFILVQFVVPGLIILFLRTQFTTGRLPKPTDAALNYLVLSLIYYGVYYSATLPFGINNNVSDSPFISFVVLLIRILVAPAIFGLFLGYLAQKSFFYKIALKIGLRPIHPKPTAWDYKFSHMKPSFVAVQLKKRKNTFRLLWQGIICIFRSHRTRPIY